MESNEASVALLQVSREEVHGVWPLIYRGVVTYNEKSPHWTAAPLAVLENLQQPDGDVLLLIAKDRAYAGFITYKVIELEQEYCAAIAMIYADEDGDSVLPDVMPRLRKHCAQQGCSRISFFTARRGFIKLAPRLGFKPRIIEWTMEVT